MAKATVVTPPVERVISLELTEREAAFVLYLTGSVVTGASDGPRAHSDAIYAALRAIGISTVAISSTANCDNPTYFGSYPEGFK